MGERDIDKYFKTQLKGYSKEVDTDAIWSALELDGNKKRPIFIWFASLCLIMFLAITFYSSGIFNADKKIKASITKTSVIQSDFDDLISDPKSTIIEKAKVKGKTNSFSDQIRKASNDKNIIETSKSPQNNSSNNNIFVHQNSQIKVRTNTKLFPTIEAEDIHNKEIKNISLDRSKGQRTKSQRLFVTKNEAQPDEYFIKSTDHSVELSTTDSNVFSLDMLGINVLEPFFISERKKLELGNVKIEKKNKRASSGLSLSIYSGIYKIDRTLTAHNLEITSFVAKKESTESPLELFSLGTQLKYDFGAFYLKAGLEFQSLNEKFEIEHFKVLDTVPAQGTVGILIGPNGNPTDQLGTVMEERTLTTRRLHYNNHRLYTIPFSLGYEMEVNKWSLFAEAQTLFNFHHSFSGSLLDQDNKVTNDSDTINKSFKLGLGVSVGGRYSFSNTISVYLRPHFFRYKDSFTKESELYSQKYIMYGLQMGLSYKMF